jgi:hypothetical protein
MDLAASPATLFRGRRLCAEEGESGGDEFPAPCWGFERSEAGYPALKRRASCLCPFGAIRIDGCGGSCLDVEEKWRDPRPWRGLGVVWEIRGEQENEKGGACRTRSPGRDTTSWYREEPPAESTAPGSPPGPPSSTASTSSPSFHGTAAGRTRPASRNALRSSP